MLIKIGTEKFKMFSKVCLGMIIQNLLLKINITPYSSKVHLTYNVAFKSHQSDQTSKIVCNMA